MLRHFRQFLDGEIAHASQRNIIILEQFRHGKEEVSRFSRRKLFALVGQVNDLAACLRAASRA